MDGNSQMTLDDILKAMRAGEADSRHADALAVILHDMRDAATANAGDLSLCRKALGLNEGELVAPAMELQFKSMNDVLHEYVEMSAILHESYDHDPENFRGCTHEDCERRKKFYRQVSQVNILYQE